MATIGDRRFSSRFSAVKSGPPALAAFLAVSLGNAFLIRSPWIAAILWLAVTRDIRFPLYVIVGLVVADIVAWLIGMGEEITRAGWLRVNAIFASLATGWLVTAAPQSTEIKLTVAVAAATFASFITAALVWALRSLPPLQWGYCLAGAILFTIFPVWTESALQATLYWPRPIDAFGWFESFFRSLGMLLFLPKPEVGALVALAVLLWSRVMFLSGVLGWLAGVSMGLFLETLGLNYLWLLAAHNYFLAAALLSATFFLPGVTQPFMAVVAGAGAAAFAAYFQFLIPGSSYAFLPIPAALSIWFGMGALSLNTRFKRNNEHNVPPEMALWNRVYWTERFGHGESLFIVPVVGPVTVAQGFQGQYSHSGPWRHALDFQRPAAAGEIGNAIWRSPVYAPAAGIVDGIRSSVADNPLGVSNFADQWGNYVLIRLDRGGWAMLAHLRMGTVAVTNGSRVETGTYVGEVGNSGRSPVPHLHLQAQISREPGAPTMPFRLANFVSASGEPVTDLLRWNATGLPLAGAVIAAARPNPNVHAVLASISSGAAVWHVETEGKIPRQFLGYKTGDAVSVRISLDENGRHLFSSRKGQLVTYVDVDAWRLLSTRDLRCPLLRLLALAAPSVPYAAIVGTNWQEPVPLPPIGINTWYKYLVLPYRSELAHLACRCTATPHANGGLLTIESEPVTPDGTTPKRLLCQLDRVRGPVKLEAWFDKGHICHTLVSFSPGLPFER
jgi:murein DD-endopeptidase MepM/ murein hydrolase activator NlpD